MSTNNPDRNLKEAIFLAFLLRVRTFLKKKAINQLIAECLQTYDILARYEIYKSIKRKIDFSLKLLQLFVSSKVR